MEQSEWREGKIKNYKQAIKFLENYRWSSHLDYLGKKNFSSVTNRKLLLDFFGGEQKYHQDFYNWLKSLKDANDSLISEFTTFEK